MRRKLEIIFDMKDNKGNLSILLDGKVLPRVFGYDIHFNARSNEFSFKAQRLATDEYGQYFVDDKGETATEEIDMLKFLTDDSTVREYVKNAKADVEFILKNVRDTSLLNARRMIRERLA
jgi:hypothetical protein